ncbi:Flp family type IVb pilin [Burkholderia cepacia]|nr:Flp family type IVb pilin [Burkholderia cepacia]
MQANACVVCRRIGGEQGRTSIESASFAAMFAVAVLGGIATLKGLLANPHVVIATAVTAAVATALAMVS